VADVWDELAEAVSTPSANPVISLTPTATPTPTPELGLLERMRQSAYAIPEPFRSLGGMGLSALENPRMIPEEAASISGSIVGGGVGSIFGPVGTVLGGALGSYADVPVQKAIDYFTGVTPTESRLGQATQEAALGAGIESALRLAGPVGSKFASPLARKATSSLADYFGPQTAQKAEFLVGEELGRLTTLDELAKASEAKKALSSTLPAETLTTAEMTGSDTLAQAERLLKTQPAGNANIEFAANARQKLEDINQSALERTNLGDPNPKRAGEAAKALLEGAEERQRQAASKQFTDEVRDIVAPIEGIAKQAKNINQEVYQTTKVFAPEGELGDLFQKIQKLEGKEAAEKAPAGFGRTAAKESAKPTETSVGMLQDLRSKALELSRAAPEGSRDELFANRIVDLLGKKIDAIGGTEGLTAARAAWREYKQRWFFDESGQRAPLNKLLRKQSPEDIIADVSKKSAVSDEYAKVLGGLEPNKLASEMADFANKQTVDEKLKWIRDKRAVYADSPIWPLVQGWEDILTRTAKATKAADVPALSPKNIDIQAKSLVRALGGSERVLAASAGEDATVSAMGNIARSGATSTLGGKISGALSTAALGLGIPTVQRGTDLAAEALTRALQNPDVAAEFVAKAQRLQQMSPRLAAQRSQQLTDRLNTIAPQAAAFGRGVMGLGSPEPIAQQATTPSVPPATTTPTVESDPWAELESAVGPMAEASPTPEPTPKPETITVGKQNISIPTGDKYAPASLVKAVMRVESAGKANAVSPKGASGLMQLMPGTAKSLGVDPTDPQQNVEGGSRYLRELLDKYNSEELALAAYNWGPGNMDRAIRKVKAAGSKATWANLLKEVKVPKETRQYVPRVLSYLA
jgi:soluble lytic murein transglycosylase-like protein